MITCAPYPEQVENCSLLLISNRAQFAGFYQKEFFGICLRSKEIYNQEHVKRTVNLRDVQKHARKFLIVPCVDFSRQAKTITHWKTQPLFIFTQNFDIVRQLLVVACFIFTEKIKFHIFLNIKPILPSYGHNVTHYKRTLKPIVKGDFFKR